jgi:hypothetical protein
MSKSFWPEKDAEIERALNHARDMRMCLPAAKRSGRDLLKRRVREGILLSPFPGVYEEPAYWRGLDPSEKSIRVIRAAALLHPSWVFCESSAAIAYELEVSCPNIEVIHVANDSASHIRNTDHVKRLYFGGQPSVASGVKVTPLDRCVFDCARNLDMPFALAVTDSYARQKSFTSDDLVAEFARVGCGLHGIHHAQDVARLTDPRAENGGESVARGTMIELGFAAPELQVPFSDPFDPQRTYRVDFYWEEGENGLPIIGELDGLGKYTIADGTALKAVPDIALAPTAHYTASEPLHTALRNLSHERLRESRLTLGGTAVMRFDFATVLDKPRFEALLTAFGVPRTS